MSNSVVVNLFMNIWEYLKGSYRYSNLKKINHVIGNGIRKLSKGSNVVRLFTSSRSLIEEGFLYYMYCSIIDRINNLFLKLRKTIVKNSTESIIYNTLYSLFKDDIHLIKSFCVFFLSFSIGIIANNIVRGFYIGRSSIIALILVLISTMGLSVKNYKSILTESHFYLFMKSIFTIDEGVDQWW